MGRNFGSAWKKKMWLLSSSMDFAWGVFGAKQKQVPEEKDTAPVFMHVFRVGRIWCEKSKHAVRTNYA
ncbi:hypothetical protein A2U01_0056034, partial [Trifolium medium]|nr:hypothetical protein [Trifolium medium]